jgi:2-oxoisovalerate dehydrogenase E1 component alpha subunit
MTYRVGAHSTSDDDSKYRRPDSPETGFESERAYWDARSPIIRFGRFLEARGLWSGEEEEALRKVERARSIKALNDAEKVGACRLLAPQLTLLLAQPFPPPFHPRQN